MNLFNQADSSASAAPNERPTSSDPLRLVLIGPIAGACAGVIDTLTGMILWEHFGRPDFFFRGPDGIIVCLLGVTVGGVVVFTCLGAAVRRFEKATRRRVHALPQFIATILIAVTVFGCMNYYSFANRTILPFLPHLSTLILAFVSALLLSSRITDQSTS